MGDDEYLQALIQERDLLQQQGIAPNAVKLLEKEMRTAQSSGEPVSLTDKVFVPIDKYPEYNFIGRILGPKGMYLKRLENENGCRLFIRGAGSLRDKAKEERMKSVPGNEHLSEPLHVLIQVQQPEPLASEFLKKARSEIERLMVPVDEKEDRVKWEQLSELKSIRESERSYERPRGYGPDRSYGAGRGYNRGDQDFANGGRSRFAEQPYEDRAYRAPPPRPAPYPERAAYAPQPRAAATYPTAGYEAPYSGGFGGAPHAPAYAEPAPYREPPPVQVAYAAPYEAAPQVYSQPAPTWQQRPY
eukprot:TRINITY_DN2766_c0_g1_i1.p1 TRINITY_DN2766_c0_g1~~TRINITY_DN2766_c0_g1_i1.p1  ORF type:complete len:302 (+),score=33.49 TRINITY_DN2766_c0_g1_i1:40-945(+)